VADLLSRTDLFAIARAHVLGGNLKISAAAIDTTGADANVILAGGSIMAYQVMLQAAFLFSALFLETAEKEDLDRWAWDRYKQRRKPASPSYITLTVYRNSLANGAGDVPAGTRAKSRLGNTEFFTLDSASFSTDTTEVTVRAKSTEAGPSQKVGANYVTKFSDTAALFDANLRVTNESESAGGEDTESDNLFRARLRGFWQASARGTLAAIEFGALTTEGVESVVAEEVLDNGVPARAVNLYHADSAGLSNEALSDAVEVQLEEWRAAGIYVNRVTSIPQIEDVLLSLVFAPGVNTIELRELVRSAVVEYINGLPVGGALTRTGLGAVLERFRTLGLRPDSGSIVAPVGDVVPDLGYTIRTRMENVVVV
jgi:hypothetical protein